MSGNIALIDSGAGGLTVLKALKNVLPYEDYVYYADKKNMPYGNKSCEELKQIALQAVVKLSDCFDIKLFVLACNTLTAVAIDFLRQTFTDKIFVGVEPNVSQAKGQTSGNVLVLLTPSALNCGRLSTRLFDNRTIFLAMPHLAELIEEGADDKAIKELTKNCLTQITAPYSAVVLGCTHYSLKKELFSHMFNLPVYDGNEGVAKRVVQILTQNNNFRQGFMPVTSFCSSGFDGAKTHISPEWTNFFKKN